MLLDIMSLLHHWLNASLPWAMTASLTWGALSILVSPCHLGSIPLIVGYIHGRSKDGQNLTHHRAFLLSQSFAFGILLTIALVGLFTGLMGRMLGDIGIWGNILAAAIFFIFGLNLLDVLPLIALSNRIAPQEKDMSQAIGYKGAFFFGFAFGLALGPCSFAFLAPVLAVTFQAGAVDLALSASLIGAFAVGHCAVIALAGSFSAGISRFLNWDSGSRAITIVRKLCGVLVLLAGLYFIAILFL